MSTKKLDKRKAETLINSMFPFFKPERETGLECPNPHQNALFSRLSE